jgi:hypothetical protein
MSISKIEIKKNRRKEKLEMEQENKTGIRKLSVADLATLDLKSKGSVKKTKSLYDSPLADRTYWGNDVGSELLMALIRPKIFTSLKNGYMYNFLDDVRADRLSKKHIMELKEHEFNLMITLFTQDNIADYIIPNDGGTLSIYFDDNLNTYSFKIA